MVQYRVRYKKSIAIEMRRRGVSYSEIETRLGIAKSTLNFWLKDIALDPDQVKKNQNRQLQALKKSSGLRKRRREEEIETIQKTSSNVLGGISNRELWLMGIILYWRQGAIVGERKGVSFSSSDVLLLRLFMKWLCDIGKVEDDELLLDIFASRRISSDSLVNYWSKELSFPVSRFTRIYRYGPNTSSKKSNPQPGFLRIRVRGSSLLAYQISAWVNAINTKLGI